ncbi:MAG: SEC-C metal-binding domain-containing protein [Lachnospirales bacterium]
MKLYEKWLMQAYTKEGNSIPAYWNLYMPSEQKIYEKMLSTKNSKITGTIKELSTEFKMKPEQYVGFIDGLSDVLDKEIDLMELTEDSEINVSFDFEELFKKMVEYKAEHLYNLPQWTNVFTKEELNKFYKEQKISRTVKKENKVGRNDLCTCGSGKKYKKCCGAK